MMDMTVYAERRAQILEKIDDGIAIIPTAPHQPRNSDVRYPYRPDSDFYFLTNFSEPEAVAVLAPGNEKGDYILFCRQSDRKSEIWHGRRAGTKGAVEHFQADKSYPISKLDKFLPRFLEDRKRIYCHLGRYADFDADIVKWLKQTRQKSRAGVRAPTEIVDIGQYLHEMRLFKQPSEIEKIKHAAKISADAHRQVMQFCKPGMTEFQIQAQIEFSYRKHNCEPAYPSIVAAGDNACILHYVDNTDQLKDGDLLLIDSGAEYQYYASDITRTFPINGRFSPHQRAVYEIVLAAQKRAIESVKPGSRYSDLNDVATEVIVEGLIDLGILKGSKEKALETEGYKPYYMHKVGHWLGLDVHDVGSYRDDSGWRKLEPNMYMTIEPGIYLSPSEYLDEKWHGIGVRIEDDVLVTESGNLVTTSDVPKEIDEIEQLMSG